MRLRNSVTMPRPLPPGPTQPFAGQLGEITPIAGVKDTFFSETMPLPFDLHAFRVEDRIGLFLTDNARLAPGTYPPPDGGVVTVFPFAELRSRDRPAFRLVVKRSHYGRPRFPFVEIDSPGTPWYGRVWLLFSCMYQREPYNLALVSYLQLAPAGRSRMTCRQAYVWSSAHVECVEVALFRRTVVVVSSYLNPPGVTERRRLMHIVKS